jgi:hypothetical protein
MFNLFNKKKRIKPYDYIFFKTIVDKLPEKYNYLKLQISKDFILDKKPNSLGDKGAYTFLLNANLESKYGNKSFPAFFIIKDIKIWNNVKNNYYYLELHILEGMLAGYYVACDISTLNAQNISLDKIKEKHFLNKDKNIVKNIIGDDISPSLLSQLDIETAYKIELPEGEYFIIKHFDEANYIAINNLGEVFGMIHDPYEVELIFNSTEKFFEALKSKEFDFKKYFDSKMQ